MRGIVRDAREGTVWVYSDREVYSVAITDEDRDIWRLYLEKGQFDRALTMCKNAAQRDRVLTAQAQHHFDAGRYDVSASCFAQTRRPFEEVALRFLAINERSALLRFLGTKLRSMAGSVSEATQATMIATWMTELYLDQLSSAGDLESDAAVRHRENLEGFLSDNHSHLDPPTTFSLIASHGHHSVMLHYAILCKDYERVVAHHVQEGDWAGALDTLSSRHAAKELFYKYSPVLMQHAPHETVDAWMRATYGRLRSSVNSRH